MKRSILIYGGLLVALLALSYLRWTGHLGTESDKDQVIVLRTEAKQIEKIAFHNEKLDVTLTFKDDELGRYAWVKVDERKVKKVKKEAPKATDSPTSGEAPGDDTLEALEPSEDEDAAELLAEEPAKEEYEEEEVEIKTTSFKGGEATDKLLTSFAPLEAIRTLEGLTPEKLETLDLVEPESWLEITRKGHVHRLELGGEAYGTKDRYVHDMETGKYYLIDADIFRPLKYAKTRMADRRLFDVEKEDLTRVVLEGSSGSVEMVHQNREDKKAEYWASKQDLSRTMEIYDNWLDKALRLRSLSYVQQADQPADLTSAFKLILHPDGGDAITLEVLKAVDEDGEEAWFARSDFTRSLVKLHKVLASEAAADVKDVIEAQPGEDPEDEDAADDADEGADDAGAPAPRIPPPVPPKLAPENLPVPSSDLKPRKQ